MAQKALADAVQVKEKLKYGMLATDPREAERPLSTHFEAYLTDMAHSGRAGVPATRSASTCSPWPRSAGGSACRNCTPPSISKYLGTLADRGLTPKTVDAHRADVAAFLNWCKKQGYLELNPCERVSKSAIKAEKSAGP